MTPVWICVLVACYMLGALLTYMDFLRRKLVEEYTFIMGTSRSYDYKVMNRVADDMFKAHTRRALLVGALFPLYFLVYLPACKAVELVGVLKKDVEVNVRVQAAAEVKRNTARRQAEYGRST